MSRPVVGIHASVEPVSWGPWRDRPSALVPAALATAVQQAGWMAVVLAPGSERELLDRCDGLVALRGAAGVDGLLRDAASLGLAAVVVTTPENGSVEDFAREIAGLLPA